MDTETMWPDADVCVLIPTLNEAATIGEVIDGFRDQDLDDVFVIDGGSSDQTRAIAREKGARVVVQTGSGKGRAVREALSIIDSEYVLMVDGDGTYLPEDATAMLEPLLEGDSEHVIGDRFAGMEPGAMTSVNRIGNRLINRAFAIIHMTDFNDVLSGYRAFSLRSVRNFRLTADGFGIEIELAIECAKHDVPTAVTPITYRARAAEAEPNLRPLRDGAVIGLTLYRLAKTSNPLFYFGSLAGACAFASIIIGAFVAIEWVTRGITHEVWAIAAAFGAVLALQLAMVGILSDLIIALHRERARRW